MIRSSLAILALAPALTFAQTLEKVEFLSPPERAILDAPLKELASDGPCTIVLDLQVDRTGHVLSSVASAPLSDRADPGLVVRTAELAKRYAFAPDPNAPEVHKARMTLAVGLHPFDDDHTAVPDDAPPMVETTPMIEEDADAVQVSPSFPGGNSALDTYLARMVRYPAEALEAKQEGKVFLSFLINTDGTLENIAVVQRVSPSLDKEAIRVVKSMPKWIPAQLGGKPVRTRWTMRIAFQLP